MLRGLEVHKPGLSNTDSPPPTITDQAGEPKEAVGLGDWLGSQGHVLWGTGESWLFSSGQSLV